MAKPLVLTDEQVEQVLVMVDAAAAVVAAAEREDSFEEYAALVRRIRRVPGYDPAAGDGSSAGVVDVSLFLGIGLALLGPIAVQTLNAVVEMVSRFGHRTDTETESAEIVRRVARAVRPSKEVPAETVELVVRVQVAALREWVNSRENQ
jgi:hypothetical protein